MPRRFAFRLLIPTLFVSVTGCFALFPLDEYQNGADAIDGGPTQPPPQRDATSGAETSMTTDGGGDPPVKPEGRVIFLSSATYTGSFGGVAAADKLCAELAKNVALEGTFKAILSSTEASSDVATRFKIGSDEDKAGRVLVDMKSNALALNYKALLTDKPAMAINYNERGDFVFPTNLDGGVACPTSGGIAWTDTSETGQTDNANDCNGWQNEGTTMDGRIGVTFIRELWLSACAVPCATKAHLYCGQL